MKKITIAAAVLLAGCNAQTPTDTASNTTDAQGTVPGGSAVASVATNDNGNQSDGAQQGYVPPAAQPVVSVYVDPPLSQPAPISVDWAPPPMLVDVPPPQPAPDQVWTGGYWVWEGNWVWAYGSWAPPPQVGYHWNNPYYDHRGNSVIFVNGYWGAPGVAFVAPGVNVNISLGQIGIGVVAGMRVNGPEGVFVPAPPGSYYGLIVPAPIGTSPAVVVGAAPIIRTGMRVTINNESNVSNVTNISNVTIIAPASAMANGRAVNASVPAQPHLAAAQASVVSAKAPEPASRKAIPAYVAGHTPVALPAPQKVLAVIPAALQQARGASPNTRVDEASQSKFEAPKRSEPDVSRPVQTATHAESGVKSSAQPAARANNSMPEQSVTHPKNSESKPAETSREVQNRAPQEHQAAPVAKAPARIEAPELKEEPSVSAKSPSRPVPEEKAVHPKPEPKKQDKAEPKSPE